MARILVDERWYEPVSSRSILESEYEHSILRYSGFLFPGYFCTRFSTLVESDYGSSKADLVLVDDEYRGWTVVEAELEHHSLARHVEPQMRRLVNGRYGESHALAISQNHPSIDFQRMLGLIRSKEPDFLVVVPSEIPEWRSTLGNLGVGIAVVEIFSDDLGRRVVTYEGDGPEEWDQGHVSRLKRDPVLPRAFRLQTPSALPNVDSLTLRYRGFLTTWRVVRAQRATYICPNGTLDLEEDGSYVILKDQYGNLEIELDK
jgi:hypothetical protein